MGPSRFAGDGGAARPGAVCCPVSGCDRPTPRVFCSARPVHPSARPALRLSLTPGVWSCAVTPRCPSVGLAPSRAAPAGIADGCGTASPERATAAFMAAALAAARACRRSPCATGAPIDPEAIALEPSGRSSARVRGGVRCGGVQPRLRALAGCRDGSGRLGGWGRVTRTVAAIRDGARVARAGVDDAKARRRIGPRGSVLGPGAGSAPEPGRAGVHRAAPTRSSRGRCPPAPRADRARPARRQRRRAGQRRGRAFAACAAGYWLHGPGRPHSPARLASCTLKRRSIGAALAAPLDRAGRAPAPRASRPPAVSRTQCTVAAGAHQSERAVAPQRRPAVDDGDALERGAAGSAPARARAGWR